MADEPRRISPIEMMIDRACGFDGSRPAPGVILVCPACRRQKRVAKDATDPEGTAEVHVRCPSCNSGDFDMPLYFDAVGTELFFEDRDGSPDL